MVELMSEGYCEDNLLLLYLRSSRTRARNICTRHFPVATDQAWRLTSRSDQTLGEWHHEREAIDVSVHRIVFVLPSRRRQQIADLHLLWFE